MENTTQQFPPQKPAKNYKRYHQHLPLAIEYVNNGLSVYAAAKQTNIPKTTLQRHIKSVQNNTGKHNFLQSSRVVSYIRGAWLPEKYGGPNHC